MLRFYGKSPPDLLNRLELGGICPHCATGGRFTRTTSADYNRIVREGIKEVVVNYTCDTCLKAIPVRWVVAGSSNNDLQVHSPSVVLPVLQPFDFSHVPNEVKSEIEEALRCLSVRAFNGFAAGCRRAIQATCTNLGADSTSRVKKQIKEMVELPDWMTSGRRLPSS